MRAVDRDREFERLRQLLKQQREASFLEDVELVTFAGLAFAAGVVESTRDVIVSAWQYRRRIFRGVER